MPLFLTRRLILAVPVLFGLLVLTFIMVRIVPSDPAGALAGEQATAAQVEAIRKDYGFDKPLTEQFVIYVGQILQGNFGISIYSNRPVMGDILERLPASVELTFLALFMAVFLGVPLGVIAATFHNSWIDQALRMVTVGGLAIASFWLAIMLQLLFSMALDLLPIHGRLSSAGTAPPGVTGLYLIDSVIAGQPDTFFDALRHIALPVTTIAAGAMATITRFTRSAVLETLQTDFVIYETAIGLPRTVIMAKYVLRNSIVTTVTQVGLLFGSILSSAVVVEAIFDWPGLGTYAVGAIMTSDYQAIIAVVLIVGLAYVLINITIDLIHAWIDPRVREQL